MTISEFPPVGRTSLHGLPMERRIVLKATHSAESPMEVPTIGASNKLPLGSESCGTHAIEKRPSLNIDRPGFLRLRDVLALFPVSRASWYAGIVKGIYPPSVALGPRSVGWRTSDIKALIENPSAVSTSATPGSLEIKSKRKGAFTT